MVALSPPLRGSLRVTSPFGVMTIGGKHTGVDFAAASGTPVYAAAAGVARKFKNFGGGLMVAIDHGDGTETRYAHLSVQAVVNGQHVAAGQQIAASGSSGAWITGPCLHFEVLINGKFVDPVPLLGGASAPGATLAVAPTLGAADQDIEDWHDGCRAGYIPALVGGFLYPVDKADAVIQRLAQPGESGARWANTCLRADRQWTVGENPFAFNVARGVAGVTQFVFPPLLEPAANIAVVLAALYVGWQGVKKIAG